MASKDQSVVTLSDPRALRALAHPARQTLLKELFSGRVLTATEAADLVGLTPSAVSHHLRALQKWGLAERAPAATDGRQRPWRGTGSTLRLQPSGASGSLAALELIVEETLRELSEEVHAFLASEQTDPWKDSYRSLTRAELLLTQEETTALRDALEELLAGFEHRMPGDRPPNARRTSLTMSVLPIEPPPQ